MNINWMLGNKFAEIFSTRIAIIANISIRCGIKRIYSIHNDLKWLQIYNLFMKQKVNFE